jgi:hypothetical protein
LSLIQLFGDSGEWWRENVQLRPCTSRRSCSAVIWMAAGARFFTRGARASVWRFVDMNEGLGKVRMRSDSSDASGLPMMLNSALELAQWESPSLISGPIW